jgi:hypothetical protein
VTNATAAATSTRQQRIGIKKQSNFTASSWWILGAIEINPKPAEIGGLVPGDRRAPPQQPPRNRKRGRNITFFLLEVEADLGCELDQDQETGARTQRIATRFAVAPNGERYGVRERGRRPKGSV